MKRVLSNKRASLRFCFVCLIMYTCVCIGNNSLSSAAVFIIDEGIFDKAMLGLINGLFYVSYGLGQIFFGVLGDRISPIKLIGAGIAMSAVANFTMSITTNPYIMATIWCLGGLAQSTIFPCVIGLISNMLMKEHRQMACMLLTFTYTVSALLTNFSAVLFASFFTWQGIFVFAGGVLVAMLALWVWQALTMRKDLVEAEPEYDVPPQTSSDVERKPIGYSMYKLMALSGLLSIMLPVMLRTVISTSMASWTPTLLMETFEISPGFSTTVANVIPLFNLVGGTLATLLTSKVFKNEIGTSIFFFAIAAPLLFLLINMQNLGVWATVMILGVVYAVTNGVCQTLNIMLPTHFAKFGCVSTVSGILNAMSSAGAAASFYIFGLVAQNYGWITAVTVWGILALAAILLCVVALIRWRAFDKVEHIQ